MKWSIEKVSDYPKGEFKSALFDFDGTISLIREGWQQIMKPYFVEVLLAAPETEDEEWLTNYVGDFVDLLTGKQTIYQCIRLAEEVERRNGVPLDPFEYKAEYHSRLLKRIQYRLDGLETGELDPEQFTVPGALDFLKALREKGVDIYLASGTDEEYVLNEARLLGVTQYCNGGIFGARDDYKLFSKKMVVRKIMKDNDLSGTHLIGFGDGYIEIENVCEAGGCAIGVASDEAKREGVDEWKRKRLLSAGAHAIIPDFSHTQDLMDFLFGGD